jgi:hypothetical protein
MATILHALLVDTAMATVTMSPVHLQSLYSLYSLYSLKSWPPRHPSVP